jgi:hypothetical protein
MPRIVKVILIYHRHKPIDSISTGNVTENLISGRNQVIFFRTLNSSSRNNIILGLHVAYQQSGTDVSFAAPLAAWFFLLRLFFYPRGEFSTFIRNTGKVERTTKPYLTPRWVYIIETR